MRCTRRGCSSWFSLRLASVRLDLSQLLCQLVVSDEDDVQESVPMKFLTLQLLRSEFFGDSPSHLSGFGVALRIPRNGQGRDFPRIGHQDSIHLVIELCNQELLGLDVFQTEFPGTNCSLEFDLPYALLV